MTASFQDPTEHVFRVERRRGPVWYAKYPLSNGRQDEADRTSDDHLVFCGQWGATSLPSRAGRRGRA
jgi:hypothetical protein